MSLSRGLVYSVLNICERNCTSSTALGYVTLNLRKKLYAACKRMTDLGDRLPFCYGSLEHEGVAQERSRLHAELVGEGAQAVVYEVEAGLL